MRERERGEGARRTGAPRGRRAAWRRTSLAAVLIAALAATSCRLLFPGITLLLHLANAANTAPEGQKLCAVYDVLAAQPNARALTALLNHIAGSTNSGLSFTLEQGEQILARSREIGERLCQPAMAIEAALAELDAPTDNAKVEAWVAEPGSALQTCRGRRRPNAAMPSVARSATSATPPQGGRASAIGGQKQSW
jgi:hypothetical protein